MNVVDRDSPLGNPAIYGFSLVTGKQNKDGPGKVPSIVQVYF